MSMKGGDAVGKPDMDLCHVRVSLCLGSKDLRSLFLSVEIEHRHQGED